MAGYPMPGQTDFTAQEEQQMRNSQANINSLSSSANANAKPAAAPQDNPNNAESGLNPAAAGIGKVLGRAVFGGGGGTVDAPAASNSVGGSGGDGTISDDFA